MVLLFKKVADPREKKRLDVIEKLISNECFIDICLRNIEKNKSDFIVEALSKIKEIEANEKLDELLNKLLESINDENTLGHIYSLYIIEIVTSCLAEYKTFPQTANGAYEWIKSNEVKLANHMLDFDKNCYSEEKGWGNTGREMNKLKNNRGVVDQQKARLAYLMYNEQRYSRIVLNQSALTKIKIALKKLNDMLQLFEEYHKEKERLKAKYYKIRCVEYENAISYTKDEYVKNHLEKVLENLRLAK